MSKTINGFHLFTVKGLKEMDAGSYISSDTFTVGGYDWEILFYPYGQDLADDTRHFEVFLGLLNDCTDVEAFFEITLLDQSGDGEHFHYNSGIQLHSIEGMCLLDPPDLKTADPNIIDKYYESVNLKQEVACLVLSSMCPDLQRTLEKYNAYDMLSELKTMFEEQAKQELFETVKAFHVCKQEEGGKIKKDTKNTMERISLRMLPSLRSHRRLRENIRQRTLSATIARRWVIGSVTPPNSGMQQNSNNGVLRQSTTIKI
ncbi:zinc finger, CCHC-type containing protein [Tanacetum coccineum]|uniref:Zinc finger, CCHC-type containing protein n=1 Tax=Tanacetum coccineum TaxID=301880 RepID=A0ABQ5API0_9ASTR